MNTGSKIFNLAKTAVTAVAMLGITSVSNAQVTKTFVLLNNLTDIASVSVSTNSGSSFAATSAGRFQGTFNGVQVPLFSTDVKHTLSFDSGYTANVGFNITDVGGSLVSSYYQGGLASVLSSNADFVSPTITAGAAATRSSEVAWLVDTYLNSTVGTFSTLGSGSTSLLTNEVAIQLAIWDLTQDGGDGLGAGTLRVNGADLTTYGSIVTFYEGAGQAGGQTTYTGKADFIQAPTSVIGTHSEYFATVVPEPGTYAMIAGMSVPGLILMARRRKTGSK